MNDEKRIILIDPKPELGSRAKTGLAERLRMQGYVVVNTISPSEGARLALMDPPAAVIADLWMPSISGVQLCRLLKAEPATESVPVILRGPDAPRNQFWSERAGAAAYVVHGRMGNLVRALDQAIAGTSSGEGFFTTFSAEDDIRERIAAHLDAALFDSVLAAEVRALGTCGEFSRLFDLLSQFVSRVAEYRWLAVSTVQPLRFGLHCNPARAASSEAEARAALGVAPEVAPILVEDEDAMGDDKVGDAIVLPIELGGLSIGKLAFASDDPQARGVAEVIAREIAGPIRMASLVEESHRLARVDALTGLMNRRAFAPLLAGEVARADRYGTSLSFVLLDVDHFKQINDQRGHASGDAVLAALGRLLDAGARSSDYVARWGGEEFVIALTETDHAGALVFAERMRGAIEAMEIQGVGELKVTASLGVATFEPGDTAEILVDRADGAMYAAKCAGRNRVRAAPVRAAEPRQLHAVGGRA